MDPVLIEKGLQSELEDRLLFVAAGEPIAAIGAELFQVGEIYQALGIVRLLESANTASFKGALTKAGYSRRYYLSHVRNEPDKVCRHRATRYNTALLACIAANSSSLALELADASASPWQPSFEYEDDYCYLRFVGLMVKKLAKQNVADELAQVLDRFETVVAEGGEVGRYTLARAIVSSDKAAFLGAVLARINELKVDYAEQREKMTEPGLEALLFWANSFVSVELIAMLRLAASCGMAITADLELCPTLITGDVAPSAVEDPFVELDRIRTMHLRRAP